MQDLSNNYEIFAPSCKRDTDFFLLYLQPIFAVIASDEETKKIQTVINQGMATNAQNLQNYLSTWDNYREIWEINKDMFIKRYQNLNPQVASFDADIARSVSIIMMEIIEHTVVHFSTSIDLILLNNFSLKY